jgi:hypothetical protein
MSGVFQNIDPPTPHRPASVYPPPWGEDTVAGWRGGWGGQYFGRRQTQVCTLHMLVLCAGMHTCQVAFSCTGGFLEVFQGQIAYIQ